MPADALHAPVLEWYDEHRRQLPWRDTGVSPWGVLVSEVMLQQTPVSRVVPVYREWLARWPTPGELAAAPTGEAVRAWGRLGYPRRALRLHQAATAIRALHGGDVPSSYDDLLALPGIGRYTAAAVASFAFWQRHAVLDTNVRRVLARVVGGAAAPAAHLTAGERARADALLPDDPAVAAWWAVAVMELGAVICTARTPSCNDCPVRVRCAWLAAGRPAYDGPRRAPARYPGTDREVRGRLLAVLRGSSTPVAGSSLETAWSDAVQRDRALAGLVADGLAVRCPDDRVALPQ